MGHHCLMEWIVFGEWCFCCVVFVVVNESNGLVCGTRRFLGLLPIAVHVVHTHTTHIVECPFHGETGWDHRMCISNEMAPYHISNTNGLAVLFLYS